MPGKSQLGKIKEALRAAHGQRLEGVVLYGSEARNEGGNESDIDVLVLLRGPIEVRDDLLSLDAVYPLMLEQERPIHAICVDAAEYEAGEFPLYQNAKVTGIRL